MTRSDRDEDPYRPFTVPDEPRAFRYDGEVRPGEKRQFRYEVSETYLGDPVAVPVTVINGHNPGPRLLCTAAIHGDELNGVKVCQELARAYDPTDIAGTLVLLHVVNVPGFQAQQRYIPIYDLDMNRAFPGGSANTASRMARELWDAFVSRCDACLDFHTSTRNRTTMYHTRADTANPAVDGLARAFGANVIIGGPGDDGSLRKAATDAGIPTVTVEMGKAHRFQPVLVEKAVDGVENVMRSYGMCEGPVAWPGWFQIATSGEKAWLRAEEGGLVDMHWGPYPLVRAGDTICTVSDQFGDEERVVEAPFTGLLVGVLENPVALPGHPLCHLARVAEATADEIEAEIERGEFDGYRANGTVWRDGDDD
ncbi:succinylglutamate desuccinylase/aspartoacylase family protein [Haloglomus halophilum]|uniref:succinylglutamate desuccinylase/aspartoacylase family protein n=1 Tax=Haloglomus halophilum TaxID=2962672 RepID=UPI0020C987F0|nr:succinylglutamate desuccinylase/aspartoacylase family protein [Haloglomus halophilum]